MKTLGRIVIIAACACAPTLPARADTNSYQITDLGPSVSPYLAAQAWGIGANGVIVGMQGAGPGSDAYTWFDGKATMLQPVSFRNYNFFYAFGANSQGKVAGTVYTAVGSNESQPLVWNGTIGHLLPGAGYVGGYGSAFGVNDAGIVVGTVTDRDGITRGVLWKADDTIQDLPAASTGNGFLVADAINNAGLIAGYGVNAGNAAVSVGLVYDFQTGVTRELAPTVAGINPAGAANGLRPFAVSQTGYVVGGLTYDDLGAGAFLWKDGQDMIQIPTFAGATFMSATGVNAAGWVVGDGYGATIAPWFYDGTSTHLITDLLPASSAAQGWDFTNPRYSSARGIADDGTIVGWALRNGVVHAYALSPVPEPATCATMLAGLLGMGLLIRRRRCR